MPEESDTPKLFFDRPRTTFRISHFDWLYSGQYDDTLCSTRCGKKADILIDGEPYCLDCCEALTEQWFA